MLWTSLEPGGGVVSWTWSDPDPDEWELEFAASAFEVGPFDFWVPFDTSPVTGDVRSTDTAWAVPGGFFVQVRMRSVTGAIVGDWCYGPVGLVVE